MVAKASTWRVACLAFIPACSMDLFPGPVKTSDVNIGTTVAVMPGAWCYRANARTGWPGVSILTG